MVKSCIVCNKKIMGYEPDFRMRDEKKVHYCVSHMFGFYFRCTYCKRLLLSTNTEPDRHLLVLKTPNDGKLMCPNYVKNHGWAAIHIDEFEKLDPKQARKLIREEREKYSDNKKEIKEG